MNILIIEDSKTIGSIVYRILNAYGYIPHILESSRGISTQLKTYHPEVVILSTFLEHADSLEVCQQIRKNSRNVFILGLHSKGPWNSKVLILKSGADDCITFPFPGQELLARINALLRRPRVTHLPTIAVGNIKIVPDDRKAFYLNHPLDLSRTEYQLLEYLTKNNNRSITRAELLDHVWDYSRIINSNTVDVHIQKLRKKIRSQQMTKTELLEKKSTKSERNKSNATNDLTNDTIYVGENFTRKRIKGGLSNPIKTVHGIGYRLEGNVLENPKIEAENA